ncbi:aminotransferase class I/II-fold pyridoxal phosphate-dependent enzyme [Foetidibacter luteolus]|uniref:aminotransferase class I/II-fold pyridoxal phosphate-dependent enzyme n=1 Tax=Foetidibacter luteolus TaxID=2608880 RepID=UPI00129B9972|nr:aminotransferase class I/II-fold pyridoxal phosphate-dependent enzyme [Foetidibacter luteolus]
MRYQRMPIEKESPEELGYGNIRYNLAESSVSDFVLKDIQLQLSELTLCYTDHKGKPELRELLVQEYANLHKENVLLTAGAAAALFIIATSLLEKDSHIIVVRPNYATNIETPKAIGCGISYIDLRFEEDWSIDIEAVEKAIQPATKYISITHPHNPTGVLLAKEELEKLIDIAERYNIYLLVDETYRDLNFKERYPLAASFSSHVISVSSVSKAYGLPGLRLGWLVTGNEHLMEIFLAAKEQIFITNSVLDEEVAYQFMVNRQQYFPVIQQSVKEKFDILEAWIEQEARLQWVKPGGGVVCFPKIKTAGTVNMQRFYQLLLHKYGTMVGPGHWFNMPDTYMRIGYGWPTADALKMGLSNISLLLDEMGM